MEFRSKSTHPAKYRGACLVLGLFEKKRLGEAAQRVDKASNGFLSEVLKTGDILGEEGQTLMLYQVPGIESERVLLVGLGKRKEYTVAKLCKAVTTVVTQLNRAHAGDDPTGRVVLTEVRTRSSAARTIGNRNAAAILARSVESGLTT
ncbi:hypothetical protein CCP4SC76_6860002 [Gammaproteobacteria bacterium]